MLMLDVYRYMHAKGTCKMGKPGKGVDFKKPVVVWSSIIFVLYTAFMIYVLFLSSYYNRTPGREEMNLIPFKTINNYIKYFKHYGLERWLTNLFGNVIVFIPLGILLPILFKRLRCFLYVLSVTFFSSLLAEILQRVFRVGSFDVDDIILNTIGGAFGYLVYLIIMRIWGKNLGLKK
jgi:glycopeptide antibiotics resistance protein